MERDRSELARRAFIEQQIKTGQLAVRQAAASEREQALESARARAEAKKALATETTDALSRLETAGFPNVEMLTIGYRSRAFRSDLPIEEPGWQVYEDDNPIIGDTSGPATNTKIYLLANGRFLRAHHIAGRGGSHTRFSTQSIEQIAAWPDTAMKVIEGIKSLAQS